MDHSLGPLNEGAVSEADWGSVVEWMLDASISGHSLHRFAVPLPQRGRQGVRCWVKAISIFPDLAAVAPSFMG